MVMASLAFLTLPVFAAGLPDVLFQNDEILKVELTAPLSTLIRDRPQEEYLPAVFSFKENDGTYIKLDGGIRTRGNFRHKNCDFPPLSLNLRKSQVEGTLFDNQKEFVRSC